MPPKGSKRASGSKRSRQSQKSDAAEEAPAPPPSTRSTRSKRSRVQEDKPAEVDPPVEEPAVAEENGEGGGKREQEQGDGPRGEQAQENGHAGEPEVVTGVEVADGAAAGDGEAAAAGEGEPPQETEPDPTPAELEQTEPTPEMAAEATTESNAAVVKDEAGEKTDKVDTKGEEAAPLEAGDVAMAPASGEVGGEEAAQEAAQEAGGTAPDGEQQGGQEAVPEVKAEDGVPSDKVTGDDVAQEATAAEEVQPKEEKMDVDVQNVAQEGQGAGEQPGEKGAEPGDKVKEEGREERRRDDGKDKDRERRRRWDEDDRRRDEGGKDRDRDRDRDKERRRGRDDDGKRRDDDDRRRKDKERDRDRSRERRDKDRDGRRDRDKDRERGDKYRDKDRDRDRERERDKDRRRDRDRERERDRSERGERERVEPAAERVEAAVDVPDDVRERERFEKDTGLSIAVLAQVQQQALQRQLMTQQMAATQSTANTNTQQSKKARQLYVGNLQIGVITDATIRELFNTMLARFVPDPVTNPPVVHVSMDPSGRFGFVELRTEELATEAVKLDKTELSGRQINVGRPKGYVEPSLFPGMVGGMSPADFVQKMQAQQVATRYLLMDNILDCQTLREEQERVDLSDEFHEECHQYGTVEEVFVLAPLPTAKDTDSGRLYLAAADTDEARKIRDVLVHRTFEGKRVLIKYVLEEEYMRAKTSNEWVDELTRRSIIQAIGQGDEPLPPMPPTLPIVPGLTKEGVVLIKGIPPDASKAEIARFFYGCGEVIEHSVRIALRSDGSAAGQAFVEIKGAGADVQLALNRSGKPLASRSEWIVQVLPSSQADVDQALVDGFSLL